MLISFGKLRVVEAVLSLLVVVVMLLVVVALLLELLLLLLVLLLVLVLLAVLLVLMLVLLLVRLVVVVLLILCVEDVGVVLLMVRCVDVVFVDVEVGPEVRDTWPKSVLCRLQDAEWCLNLFRLPTDKLAWPTYTKCHTSASCIALIWVTVFRKPIFVRDVLQCHSLANPS